MVRVLPEAFSVCHLCGVPLPNQWPSGIPHQHRHDVVTMAQQLARRFEAQYPAQSIPLLGTKYSRRPMER